MLLGEEDGKVVATVAIAFVRMTIGGEALEVGMPLRVATDPEYQGRGIFARAPGRERGARARPRRPSAAHGAERRLDPGLPPQARLVAAARRSACGPACGSASAPAGATPSSASASARPRRAAPTASCATAAWLNWRFADSPKPYTLLEGSGYGVAGRRGRVGVVAAVEGGLLGDTGDAAGGPAVIAAPPPWELRRYVLGGFVPTRRTFTVLGKSLHPAQPVPARPHFELGDLDFL